MDRIKLNLTGWTDLCGKTCEPAWQGRVLVGAIEAEKVQEGAKMMRKGATKMGPHQADSVLKAASNEHGQNMTELDQLDGSKTNLHSRDGFWWVQIATEWLEEGEDDAKRCHENGSTPGRFDFEGSIERKWTE